MNFLSRNNFTFLALSCPAHGIAAQVWNGQVRLMYNFLCRPSKWNVKTNPCLSHMVNFRFRCTISWQSKVQNLKLMTFPELGPWKAFWVLLHKWMYRESFSWDLRCICKCTLGCQGGGREASPWTENKLKMEMPRLWICTTFECALPLYPFATFATQLFGREKFYATSSMEKHV